MKKQLLWYLFAFLILVMIMFGSGLLIAALSDKGSVEGDGYRIYEENGVSYVSGAYPGNITPFQNYYYTFYPSIDMLQKTVLAGEANMDYILSIATASDDPAEVRVDICDFRKVYDAIFPLGMEQMYINFVRSGYAFEACDYPVYASLITSGKVAGVVDQYYWKPYNDPQELNTFSDGSLISVQDISDRSAREIIIEVKSSLGDERYERTHRFLFYTVQGLRGKVYVREEYLSKSDEPDEILDNVCVYGEDQGADFKCTISGLKERPSKAWLASFGIRLRLDLLRPFAY